MTDPTDDDVGALIDRLSPESSDEEIEATLLRAFGLYALTEIPSLGAPADVETVLTEWAAPFAKGESS